MTYGFRGALLAAVMLCAAGTPALAQPIAVPPPTSNGPQAPQSDYAQFRALNAPYRLIDFLVAGVAGAAARRTRQDPGFQAQGQMMITVYTQVLTENQDAVIDTIMSHAFVGFSHDEVVRLSRKCTEPIRRAQDFMVDSYAKDENPTGAQVNEVLNKDAAYRALTDDDRALIVRFARAMTTSINQSQPVMSQVRAAVQARINHQPEPKIEAHMTVAP